MSYEICQHAERTSLPNSVHRICQMQCEEDNGIDGEGREFCKECMGKKHDIGAAIDLEAEHFSDTNKKCINY